MQNQFQKAVQLQRDIWIFELAKKGMTYRQIAEKVALEYPKVTRQRIAQIVWKMVASK